MSAGRATGLPANDKAGIRSHVMIHSLAGSLAREGKLVARFLGEDANGTHPRTGKSGIKLTPVVPHFVIGDVESAVRTIVNIVGRQHRNAEMVLAGFRPELRSGGKGYEKDIVGNLEICAGFDDADAARWSERLPLAPNYLIETSAGRLQCFYLFEPVEAVKPVAERPNRLAHCDHRLPVWQSRGGAT